MSLSERFSRSSLASSLGTRLRRKRFAKFKTLLADLSKPAQILDVGGTIAFWESMEYASNKDIHITIVNLTAEPSSYPNISCLEGDGRHLEQFADNEFDIAFSNSVIEHLPDTSDQRLMAEEMRRVGKRYFVQTPNRFFPIEPHFAWPAFHFLPVSVRAGLLRHFNLGWFRKRETMQAAREAVNSIRLLSASELTELFPDAELYREYMFGLTKSLIAISSWEGQRNE